jgi:putative transcriptional regulator
MTTQIATAPKQRKAKRDVKGELVAYLARLESGEKPRLRKTTMERKPDGTMERKVYSASGKLESEQTFSMAATARMQSGLSQSRFAALLGVSVRTLQEWEQGRKQPSGAAKTLLAIASKRPDVLNEFAPADV